MERKTERMEEDKWKEKIGGLIQEGRIKSEG